MVAQQFLEIATSYGNKPKLHITNTHDESLRIISTTIDG